MEKSLVDMPEVAFLGACWSDPGIGPNALATAIGIALEELEMGAMDAVGLEARARRLDEDSCILGKQDREMQRRNATRPSINSRVVGQQRSNTICSYYNYPTSSNKMIKHGLSRSPRLSKLLSEAVCGLDVGRSSSFAIDQRDIPDTHQLFHLHA